jgi:hypothetical protein
MITIKNYGEEGINLEQGKITIMNMIVFCILVLAAVMAFKYVAGNVDKKQIKKEVFDEMGIFRGAALTEEKYNEIVDQVLGKRSLQSLESDFSIDAKGLISYYFKYELSINYLLFERSEIVEVEGEMENYGG